MANPSTDAVDWDEGDVEPHEAFALLADQNRFDIIRVVANASRTSLSFSDLYEESNFDDSGQFNYHLDKLIGPFLRKTEDGYSLRHAARIAYRLAVSGLLSDQTDAELTTVNTTCPKCEAAQLSAVYEGDRFWIRCRECERRAIVGPFPPRALENYEAEQAPAVFDRYTMGLVVQAAENVCPWCASQLSASIEAVDESWPMVDWVICRTCDHCKGWIYTRVYDLLRLHPAVITFYYDHGIDISGCSFWEAERIMAEEVTVRTEIDEWAVRVSITHDGDKLQLGVSDDMCVSTIEVL